MTGTVSADVTAGETAAVGPGPFVAVVGPSGAGKDAVIGHARARLPAAVVVQRVITRAPGGGEDCREVTDDEFAAIRACGGFAASWEAHGLRYGIPAAADDLVRADRLALANVSRTAIDTLATRYARFRVVRVTAPVEVRAARLARRGREGLDDVRARLDRPDPAPEARVDLEIVNDGDLAVAGDLLVAFLRSL